MLGSFVPGRSLCCASCAPGPPASPGPGLLLFLSGGAPPPPPGTPPSGSLLLVPPLWWFWRAPGPTETAPCASREVSRPRPCCSLLGCRAQGSVLCPASCEARGLQRETVCLLLCCPCGAPTSPLQLVGCWSFCPTLLVVGPSLRPQVPPRLLLGRLCPLLRGLSPMAPHSVRSQRASALRAPSPPPPGAAPGRLSAGQPPRCRPGGCSGLSSRREPG